MLARFRMKPEKKDDSKANFDTRQVDSTPAPTRRPPGIFFKQF